MLSLSIAPTMTWIHKFEDPRLNALRAIKQKAGKAVSRTNVERPTFVYVTYIESTPEQVWPALTDADITATCWGHRNVSDWEVGSRWEHQRTDGSRIADCLGTVIESAPPTRIVTTWEDPAAASVEPSRVTFTIEQRGAIVRLTVPTRTCPTQPTETLRPTVGQPFSRISSPCSKPATFCPRPHGSCRSSAPGPD